jgi:enterobacteria phage integrase
MGRPRESDYPPHMTREIERGTFRVRNPVTGHKKRFTDEAEARAAAEALAEWLKVERQREIIGGARPTFALLVKRYKAEQIPLKPWSVGTRRNYEYKLNKIAKLIGDRFIDSTDCAWLTEWLSFCTTADIFNKWRTTFELLYQFGVSVKLATTNEASKVLPRSMSKKIKSNRKRRRPLDIAGFKAIREKAEPWLQLAMDLSLLTLQSRSEVCNMQHDHFRDGFLYVIREKVANQSEMGFIRIPEGGELAALRQRARVLDHTISPYLVHRAPVKRKRRDLKNLPHWTYVRPHYLSQCFLEARDATGLWSHLDALERPSFHEIRGLASRLSRARGVSKGDIQALMTHSNPKTTAIYLEGGAQALRDEDFIPVKLTLSLSEVLA